MVECLRKQVSLNWGAEEDQMQGNVPMWAWELQMPNCITFLIECLRWRTNLSPGAPDIKMHGFLNGMLKEKHQSEQELQMSECMAFVIECLRKHQSEPGGSRWLNARKHANLRLVAPEIKMHQFLNKMLQETNQSELGSSRGQKMHIDLSS